MGVQSKKDSESDHLTNKGSTTAEPIGLAPKAIQCLSTSEIITCSIEVGISLAPPKELARTARVVTPLLSSHT